MSSPLAEQDGGRDADDGLIVGRAANEVQKDLFGRNRRLNEGSWRRKSGCERIGGIHTLRMLGVLYDLLEDREGVGPYFRQGQDSTPGGLPRGRVVCQAGEFRDGGCGCAAELTESENASAGETRPGRTRQALQT